MNNNSVNNNDSYFGNSIPSSPKRKGVKKKVFDDNLISLNLNSNFKNNKNLSTDLNSSYISDEDDNDYQDYSDDEEDDDDHYKSDFFNSVSQKYKKKEITNNIHINNDNNTINNNNENYNNDNNNSNSKSNSNSNSNSSIVLVNTKNTLQYSQKEKNKTRKKNTKKLLECDRNNLEYTLNRLKDSSSYCGGEFSRLLSSVNSICNNITKLSHDNMENYSNIIDKTTFESVKCAESMKMLINNMELLNSDIFEIYKLNNQIKNVKKDVDQLEILMKTLIKQ
ncbi:hypothetical protein RB653_005238 [Dictyostelium firmibasis]|uniref:BLOC-1-related complex subunit 6 C-terminal helix domain-containing protein n=1 Tax=Dictyostelium firmibasis TaxID=79012 RepID=A0AAN7Z3Y9_9MYCE